MTANLKVKHVGLLSGSAYGDVQPGSRGQRGLRRSDGSARLDSVRAWIRAAVLRLLGTLALLARAGSAPAATGGRVRGWTVVVVCLLGVLFTPCVAAASPGV